MADSEQTQSLELPGSNCFGSTKVEKIQTYLLGIFHANQTSNGEFGTLKHV